ncbi:MAG TPA: hypothetical protein VF016_03175, partial [Nitrososphaera sp.]
MYRSWQVTVATIPLLLSMFLLLVSSAAGDVTDMTATKPVLKSDSVPLRPLAVGDQGIFLSTDVRSHLNET